MRLRELGFKVHRITRHTHSPDWWEVDLGVAFHGLQPPVDSFRERLRRALRALGSECARAKIRVSRTGF